MAIKTIAERDKITLEVTDHMIIQNVPEFTEKMLNVYIASDIVLEMMNITYINSEIVGHIVELHKRTEAAGYKLTVIVGQKELKRFFKNLHFDQVLTIRISDANRKK